MEIGEFRELISKADELHQNFGKKFAKLFEPGIVSHVEDLRGILHELYSLAEEKFNISSQIYKAAFIYGLENEAKELQKNEHQMKFRLEEVLAALTSALESYSERTKLNSTLQRLLQFYRVYDYSAHRALQALSAEVEGLTLIGRSEKEKKLPGGILERINKISKLEEDFNTLLRFTYHLYTHPSWVHKVEEALREWHSMGLLWVEARNVEKKSGVERDSASEILEGLMLIGLVEKKMRGGESVYKLRGFGEDKGNI
ncbi:hypothetical protein PAP_06085 [Palaeococcus pacificus DY20341]|uniref:Uncharacterized protein n=1 Tax=Palaeococcus pacificus DY20341 TaxID=1343739 RepID=A0A075LUG6_9EURY|nr:hypothetical protein [Palaeococcus pacificus]AIF69617.1 hypothetical protein PAP_06085 [Palaeococcus pacificus DY20341]